MHVVCSFRTIFRRCVQHAPSVIPLGSVVRLRRFPLFLSLSFSFFLFLSLSFSFFLFLSLEQWLSFVYDEVAVGSFSNVRCLSLSFFRSSSLPRLYPVHLISKTKIHTIDVIYQLSISVLCLSDRCSMVPHTSLTVVTTLVRRERRCSAAGFDRRHQCISSGFFHSLSLCLSCRPCPLPTPHHLPSLILSVFSPAFLFRSLRHR